MFFMKEIYKYYSFGTGNKIPPKISRANRSIKKNSPVSLFQSSPFFNSRLKYPSGVSFRETR